MAENKTVQVSSAELNELLDLPGADSVITDTSMFKRTEGMTEFNPQPKTDPSKDEKGDDGKGGEKKELEEPVVIADPGKEQTQPVITGNTAVELTKKLIEEKIFVPFDDDKKLEDYTMEDFEELIKANLQDKENKLRTQVPSDFFKSLPRELQYAAKYVADGGQDLKSLFQTLAQIQQVDDLSEKEPEDQESIVREYLLATNYGTPEEVNEEIDSLKDLKKLGEKAEKFQPKLKKLYSERIEQRLQAQEARKQQQTEAAQNYADSVYEALEPGKINDIPLDPKIQNQLYTGLVNPQYPSISGKQTNLFGHLIEKYQFVEPNHALMAEVLWHLMDPEGFKQKVSEAAKNKNTEEIVRKLKTEQTNKLSSQQTLEKEEARSSTKIQRPSTNFFKR